MIPFSQSVVMDPVVKQLFYKICKNEIALCKIIQLCFYIFPFIRFFIPAF